MVICNNGRCKHNGNIVKGVCDLDDTYIDDDSCVSRHKKPLDENYNDLMKSSEPRGYKRKGKYVSN